MSETVQVPSLIETTAALEETVAKLENQRRQLQSQIEESQINANKVLNNALSAIALKGIDEELLRLFVKRPYLIMPRDDHSWFLLVPRFVPMQVGWLDRSDAGWNIFVIDRYSEWLGTVPEDIKKMIGLEEEPIQATVDGPLLKIPVDQMDRVFQKYRRFILRREQPGIFRIAANQEFNLIQTLVKDGILPFQKRAVVADDLRVLEPQLQVGADQKAFPPFTEKSEQTETFEKFLATGALGIFWPPGFGKMFLGLKLLARLKGRKLVIAPTRLVIQEWNRKLKAYLPWEAQREIEVTTYVSAPKHLNQEFSLVIFDEAQSLPATTYIKMSTLRAKYRVGLSASPYREDGRQELIFALTGFPVGLDWTRYIERGLIPNPEIHCFVTVNESVKRREMGKLAAEAQPRTIVFCDWLEEGAQIAKELGCPFVKGDTKHGLNVILSNKLTVVSRVADVGIDVTDLRTIIEVAFMGRSRRQQIQRFGRLLHSRFKGEYYILMTRAEYAQYNRRLLSLYEKGFRVKVEEISQ